MTQITRPPGVVVPRHRARQTGTYQISDLRNNYLSVYEFGLDNALAVVSAQLAAYNVSLNGSLSALTTDTTDRTESSPAIINARMQMVDEFGLTRTQKAGKTYGRGFPLDRYQYATGWTEDFMLGASIRDMVVMTDSAQLAHTNELRAALAYALYTPTRRLLREYVDPAIGYQITEGQYVQPLYDGDGEVPPVGPSGQVFDGTHNHYLVTGNLTGSDVDTLAHTVGEHSTGNNVVIYIAEVDAARFRALPGFVAATVTNVYNPITQAVTNISLDNSRTDDKFIGYTAGGYGVWIKPWAIQNYALCINLNGPRAIKRRVSTIPALRGLRLKGNNGVVNLFAQYWEDNFGFGVSNRGAAAVLYFGPVPAGAQAPVYVAPPVDNGQVLA